MVAGRHSFEGVVPVAALPRLASALARDDGEVAYRLDFEQGQLGDPELHVRLTARLTLECQRTLQPFEWPAAVDVRLGLLGNEDDAAALPGDCEPVLLEHGCLDLQQVIEDELLLALPLVPVKPGSEVLRGEWNTPGQPAQDAEGAGAVTRPFADLRRLLGAQTKKRQNR